MKKVIYFFALFILLNGILFAQCEDCDGTNVLLTINTDDWPGETTWNIQQGGNIIEQGGPYNQDFTAFYESFCLEDGDYTFEISDSFGDGICCFEGNGSYKLSTPNQILLTGGEFASSETKDFQVGGTSNQEVVRTQVGFGSALDFDGTDDFVNLPTTSLTGLTDVTFEAWVYWRGATSNQRIVNFGCGNVTYTTLIIQNGIPTLMIDTDINETLAASVSLPINTWTHLAFTFDHSSKIGSIYINGNARGSKTFVNTISQTGSCGNILGRWGFSNDNIYFNGAVDEARLWSEVRTRDQIAVYKDAPINEIEDGLLYYYDFDDGDPNQNNSGISEIRDQVAGANGELFAFQLSGNRSNFIANDIGKGDLTILDVFPRSAISGSVIKVFGDNFIPCASFNKVFFDNIEGTIVSSTDNYLEVEVPQGIDERSIFITVENDAGVSRPFQFSHLVGDPQKEYVFDENIVGFGIQTGTTISAGDFNNDGLVDIVTGSPVDDNLVWFENLGLNQFSSERVISSSCDCGDIRTFDLDGDGDLDILTGQGGNQGDEIAWFRNNGNETFSSEIQIGTGNASTVYASDLDGDGDLDLVAAISFPDNRRGLYWYRNSGTGSFTEITIELNPNGAQGVVTADIDADGDQDVIYSQRSNGIKWFENNGDATFQTPKSVSSAAIEVGRIFASDLDDNGYPDIILFDFFGTYIFFNNNESFTSQYIYGWAHNGHTGDLEGDGDLDIVLGSGQKEIAAFINNGDQNFTKKTVGNASLGGEQAAYAADFDNDGDLDVVTVSRGDGVVRVFSTLNDGNDFFDFDVQGQVSSNVRATKIDIVVANDYNLFGVIPSFTNSINADVFVNGQVQQSGVTLQNFSTPVSYSVISEAGSQKDYTVTILPQPSIPEIISISTISTTEATIKWNEGTYTDKYRINIKDEDENLIIATDVVDTEYQITGLEPGRGYIVSVRGENAFSNSLYSSEETFITIPESPEGITIDAISLSSATLSWNNVEGAIQYRLEIGLDEDFTNYFPGYNSKVITTSEENVLGLSFGKRYWVRLKSQNESGLSSLSEVVSFITKPDVPSFTFDDITQNAFAVKWNSVNGVDSVQLEIDGEIITFDGAVLESTFSELEPGSTYSLRIRSSNISGSSVWSSYQEVTLIPPDPVIASIGEISDDAAVAFWGESLGASGYIIDVSRDENFNDLIGGYNARRVSTLSESIVGLAEGTSYYVRIRAANESGTSGYSEVVTFLTIPEVPIFTLSSVVFDEVTFNWTLGSGQEGFDILQVVDGESSVTTYGGTSTEAVFTDLLPATTYQFSIRAFNSTGSSGYTIPVKLTTVPSAVGSITLQNVSQSTAVIVWDDVKGADDYLLEITENDFSTNISGYNPKTIAGTSELVENLSSGTPYRARIRSSNESGPSQYSEELSFTTIPGNPTARDASNITATAFNANWDNVAGSVDTYIIEVSDDENFENSVVIDESNALTYAVTGLSDGVSHWYRIAAKNTSGQSSYSNTVFVKQALIIGGLVYEAAPSKATTTEIPVSFTVTGGTNIHHVTFRYRGILNDNWVSNTIISSSNQYEFIILSSFMDDIGLEFEILVDDGVEQVSNLENFIYWQDIEEEVNTINLSNQWQMFSIPYVLDNPQVGAVFDEMAAFKYRSQWRLMHYNGQAYLDANGGGIGDIELGKGYWFYTTEEDITIDIGGGTVNTETPFTMNLRQGWNQIGNPYNVSINWSSVRTNNQANVAVEELLLFNTETGTFFENGVLDPFNGAFVWSNEDRSIQISLADDKSIGGRITTEVLSSNIDLDQWQLDFIMETNGNQYPIASIGMDPEANESRDELDRVTYPRFVNYLEMYTLQTDYFYPYFRKDIRPSADQMAWHFTIASNFISQGELKWDNSEMENAKNHMWLVDEKNGTVIHMNETDRYASNFSDYYSLSIYLTEDMTPPLPLFMHISDPYPNPTSNQSSIQLILPDTKKEYAVKLNIVDLSGREVVSVAEGTYQAGRHDFMTDLGRLSLKSGVYFYRLFIDDMTSSPITKKLILTK